VLGLSAAQSNGNGFDTLFNVGGFSATTVHVFTWPILVRYPALAKMVMLNLSPHCR